MVKDAPFIQMSGKQLLPHILSASAFAFIAYCSYLLVLLSLPYLSFDPTVEFLATKQLIYHIDWWRYSFYTHVFSSPLVIICGLLQFNRRLAHHHKRLHRTLGLIYISVLLLVSGPSALLMGLYANGGYIAQISFVILSLLWITFTYVAYRRVRQHRLKEHVHWMIRSYALTLSAVSLRVYAYLMDIFNVPLSPLDTYILISYLSWIINLVFAEWLIRKTSYSNFLLRPPAKGRFVRMK